MNASGCQRSTSCATRLSLLRTALVLVLLATTALAQTLTKAPTLLKSVEPAFPAGWLDAGTGASVVMDIDIAADGTVAAVKVVQSAGPSFDDAAVAAARQLVFTPAEVDVNLFDVSAMVEAPLFDTATGAQRLTAPPSLIRAACSSTLKLKVHQTTSHSRACGLQARPSRRRSARGWRGDQRTGKGGGGAEGSAGGGEGGGVMSSVSIGFRFLPMRIPSLNCPTMPPTLRDEAPVEPVTPAEAKTGTTTPSSGMMLTDSATWIA
jgi:TonB family protein